MVGATVRLKPEIQFGHHTAKPVDKANQPETLQTNDASSLLSGQVLRYDPTQYTELSDWTIIRIFQELYTLLMQFIGISGYNSDVDLRLYNALFNAINTSTIPMGNDKTAMLIRAKLKNMSINQYEALRFISNFCENEKHVPKAVKKQLRETTTWAKAMQEIFDLQSVINNRPFVLEGCKYLGSAKSPLKYLAKPFVRTGSIRANTIKSQEKQGQILQNTVESIQNRVRSLGNGESTYISTMLGGGANHLLLKVTSNGGSYTLTVLTRDSQIQTASVIAAAGKQKMLTGVPYVGVQESEFCTKEWLKPFLMLAAPVERSAYDTLNGSNEIDGSDKTALLELFRSFHNKQDLSAQPPVFKTARDGINPIKNLWMLTHGGPVMKMRMRLSAHYGFFSNVRLELQGNYMLCNTLARGNIQLRRELVYLHQNGLIKEQDLKLVTKQLDRIEKDLSKALNPKAPSPPLTMPTGYDLTLDFSGDLKAPALVPPRKGVEQPIPKIKANLSFPNLSTKRTIQRPRLNLPKIDKRNPLPALQGALATMKSFVDPENHRFQPIESQVYFMELIDLLPFEDLNDFTLDESPWHHLTEAQREEASKLLLEMSQIFQTHVRLTQTILPDRLYALTKAAYIVDLLAHLNCSKTGYKWHYEITALEKLTNFLNFEYDQSIRTFNQRIRYASPFLRLRSQYFIEKIQRLKYSKTLLVKDYSEIVKKEMEDDNERKVTGYDYFHQYEYKLTRSLITGSKSKVKTNEHPVDLSNPQNQHLKAMIGLFELFLPTYADRYFKVDANELSYIEIEAVLTDILSNRRRCSILGRPIKDNGMLGAAAKTSIGTNSNNPMLEAQLVFDPKAAFQKALKTLEKEDLKLNLPEGISDEDLMRLIKALDSENAIISTMAILDETPYLLQIPDVRNAIEMQFLNPDSVKAFVKRAPRQIKQLPRYFQKKFEFFYDPKLKRDDYVSALFIIHLSRSMQNMLGQELKMPTFSSFEVKQALRDQYKKLKSNPDLSDQLPTTEDQFIQDWIDRKESKYLPPDDCLKVFTSVEAAINEKAPYSEMAAFLRQDKHIRAMPTFDTELLMWAQSTKLLDNPKLNEARSVILTYQLDTLLDANRISEYEIKEIIIFYMQLKRSEIFEPDTDPVLSDKVQRLFARWTPAFENAFKNPAFKTAFIDLACQFFGKQIPDETWTGTYPIFECTSYKMNLATGYIARKGTERCAAPLSQAALSLLRSVCPDQDIRKCEIERIDSENEIYQFTDRNGVITQIEIDGEKPRLYKSIDGAQWLQYVPREQLFPKSFGSWYERFKGIDKLFSEKNPLNGLKDIAKSFLNAGGIPETLMGEAQFVDANNPKTIVTFDKYGKPLFKLSFDKNLWGLDPKMLMGSRLQKIQDMRPEFTEANKGRTLAIASTSKAAFLQNISRFEDLNEVILWGNKGKLEAVELTRLGLLFEIKGKKLICKTHKYEDYTLDLNPSVEDTKGIQSAIVLCPPNPKQNKVLLVAKSEDLVFENKEPTNWENFQALAKTIMIMIQKAHFFMDFFNGSAFLREILAHVDLKLFWSIGCSKTHRDVWEFQITRLENELRPPADAKPMALVDFMLHAQIAMGESHIAALQSIGEIASNMRTLEPKDFEDLNERQRNQLMAQITKIIINAQKATTPEEVGLGLRCLLLLQERMPAQYQIGGSDNGIKAYIARIFGMYLRQSKHCDMRTRIPDAELRSCFALYKEQNPEDYAKTAPYFLLDGSEHDCPIDYKNPFVPLSRRSIEPVKLGAAEDTSELVRILKYIPDAVLPPYRPYFVSKHNIRTTLRFIYSVLRTADPSSQSFQELDSSLNQIATSDGEQRLEGRLIRYLQMLCQYRKTAPLDELPPIPKLERTNKRYNMYSTKADGESQVLTALEEQERKKIKAFFTDLDRRIHTPSEDSSTPPTAQALKISLQTVKTLIEATGDDASEATFQTWIQIIQAKENNDHPITNAMGRMKEELRQLTSDLSQKFENHLGTDKQTQQLIKLIPDVDQLVRELPKTAYALYLIASYFAEVLQTKKAIKDLGAMQGRQKHTRSNAHELANMTAEELEDALNAKGDATDPTKQKGVFTPIKDLQVQHALFSEAGLSALFERRQLKLSLREVPLDLSLAKNSGNSAAVRGKAETLETWVHKADQEINKAENAPMSLRGRDEVELESNKKQLLSLIEQKHEVATAAAKASRDKILSLLSFESSDVDTAKHKAGLLNPLTWTELLICFYRDELDDLKSSSSEHERRIPPGTKIEDLRKELIQFFTHSVDAKRTDPSDSKSLYGFLKTMEQEKTLSCSFTCNQLYAMLTQSRRFNSDKESKLLLMEYYLGFLFRDIQIDFVEELIRNPNLLKQASTGSGKTAAIIPMLAQKMPNGTNLVTMKFLNPLLQASLDHLRGIVTQFLRRRVLHFSYSSDTPIEIGQGRGESTSLFEAFYKDQARAVLAGDIVVSGLTTSVNMDARLISICENKATLAPIDEKHCYYLARSRSLTQQHEFANIDESDAALHVSQKYLTCTSTNNKKPAPHLAGIVTDTFDKLANNTSLGIKTNTQVDLHPRTREQLIQQEARKAAQTIIADKSTGDVRLLNDENSLYEYFIGQEDQISTITDQFETPETKDRIDVTKDLYSTILPTVLSKKGGSKYILANDGVNVVPTEQGSPGKPSARSVFQHPIVRMAYINMWYRQMGVNIKCLGKYTKELTEDAISQLAEAHAKKDPNITNLDQTKAGQKFYDEFGKELGYKLSDLSRESKVDMLQKINQRPHLVRKFIIYVCENISITTDVTNANSHSLVASSRFKSGESATRGCPEGYHREFDKTDQRSEEDGLRIAGESLRSLKSRFDPCGEIIVYKPDCKNPVTIVNAIKKEYEKNGSQMGILIDGSTDTANADPLELAKALKGNLEKMTFWDDKGRKQVYVDPNCPGHQNAGLDKSGTLYTPAQSRGADNVNSTAVGAVFMPDLNGRLEEAYQHVGRLRRRDHQARIAIPSSWEFMIPGCDDLFKISEIQSDTSAFLNHASIQPLVQTAKQNHPELNGQSDWVIASNVLTTIIINRWAINEAESSADELYRNDQEAAIDEAREASLRDLVACADGERNPAKGGERIHEFYRRVFKPQKNNPLVHKSQSAYTTPGAYHEAFKGIASKKCPVDVLDENRKKQIAIIDACIAKTKPGEGLHLRAARDRLTNLDYSQRKDKYPKEVHVGDASCDQAEIQVESEQESQIAIEVGIQATKPEDPPSFEDWKIPSEDTHGRFTTHNSAYPPNLFYTRNCLDPGCLPHDYLQKPVNYVLVRKTSSGELESYVALDELDQRIFTGTFIVKHQRWGDRFFSQFRLPNANGFFIVDLRGIDEDDSGEQTTRLLYGYPKSGDLKKAEEGIVPLMVEGGKVSGFTKSQEAVLTKWLGAQSLSTLNSFEAYLTQTVYQFKPRSNSRYPGSQLQRVIANCRAQKSKPFKSSGA